MMMMMMMQAVWQWLGSLLELALLPVITYLPLHYLLSAGRSVVSLELVLILVLLICHHNMQVSDFLYMFTAILHLFHMSRLSTIAVTLL